MATTPDCLFCKIRDGQIPAKIIYRDDHCIGFEDIRPAAPVHVLFIPLQHIASINDLTHEDRERVGHLFIAAANSPNARRAPNSASTAATANAKPHEVHSTRR